MILKPFRNEEIFIISFFSEVQIWVLGVNKFFFQFLLDILPPGSGSVDPHIFADPDPDSDPGKKNVLIIFFTIDIMKLFTHPKKVQGIKP